MLITVLRQRFRLPQHVLATLFGVVTGTIAKAERQARPLLEQYGYQIEPAGTPIKTLANLTAYASAQRNKPRQRRQPDLVDRLVPRTRDLAAKHSVLMTENQQLNILGRITTDEHRHYRE